VSRAGAAYQGAIEAVFAILVAAGLGYWADEHFDTSPRYLLIGLVVGFASFLLRLMRMRRLLEEPPDDDEAPPGGK
jgi:F0F1-type ATP synthase assembly protein I